METGRVCPSHRDISPLRWRRRNPISPNSGRPSPSRCSRKEERRRRDRLLKLHTSTPVVDCWPIARHGAFRHGFFSLHLVFLLLFPSLAASTLLFHTKCFWWRRRPALSSVCAIIADAVPFPSRPRAAQCRALYFIYIFTVWIRRRNIPRNGVSHRLPMLLNQSGEAFPALPYNPSHQLGTSRSSVNKASFTSPNSFQYWISGARLERRSNNKKTTTSQQRRPKTLRPRRRRQHWLSLSLSHDRHQPNTPPTLLAIESYWLGDRAERFCFVRRAATVPFLTSLRVIPFYRFVIDLETQLDGIQRKHSFPSPAYLGSMIFSVHRRDQMFFFFPFSFLFFPIF